MYVCRRLIFRITDSNPEGMDIRLLCVGIAYVEALRRSYLSIKTALLGVPRPDLGCSTTAK